MNADGWQNLVGFLGTLFGGMAFGVEIRNLIDAKRHASTGKLDLVFAPSGTIDHVETGRSIEKRPYANLRIMNIGASPVRLLMIGVSGFNVPEEQANPPFGGSELLTSGEEYRIGCTECGKDAGIIVQYLDHADRRFMFFQYIEVTSSKNRLEGLSWRKLRRRYKPKTMRPRCAREMPLGPDHPGVLRIRLGKRKSPQWLGTAMDAMAQASTRGWIDMSPTIPKAVLSNPRYDQDPNTLP